jgi:hypothetical protein
MCFIRFFILFLGLGDFQFSELLVVVVVVCFIVANECLSISKNFNNKNRLKIFSSQINGKP